MRGLLFTFLLLVAWTTPNQAQDMPDPTTTQRHYAPIVYVDPPQPLGGWTAIRSMIVYPDTALALKLEGTVIVECIINSDGYAREVLPVLGPELLFNAAIDAVELSQWIPARLDGEPVAGEVTFALDFYLPDTHIEAVEQSHPGFNNPLWQLILGISAIGVVFFFRG